MTWIGKGETQAIYYFLAFEKQILENINLEILLAECIQHFIKCILNLPTGGAATHITFLSLSEPR